MLSKLETDSLNMLEFAVFTKNKKVKDLKIVAT